MDKLTLDMMLMDLIDDVFWENNYYYLNDGDVYVFYFLT